MLTASENRSFRTWLVRLDSRLMDVADMTLADVQSRLESAGVLPEPGLMHELCEHWRKGCSVSRAVSLVTGRLNSSADDTPDDSVPYVAQFGRFLAIVDSEFRRAIDYCDSRPVKHSPSFNLESSRRAW